MRTIYYVAALAEATASHMRMHSCTCKPAMRRQWWQRAHSGAHLARADSCHLSTWWPIQLVVAIYCFLSIAHLLLHGQAHGAKSSEASQACLSLLPISDPAPHLKVIDRRAVECQVCQALTTPPLKRVEPTKPWKRQRKSTNNPGNPWLKLTKELPKNQGTEGQGLSIGGQRVGAF